MLWTIPCGCKVEVIDSTEEDTALSLLKCPLHEGYPTQEAFHRARAENARYSFTLAAVLAEYGVGGVRNPTTGEFKPLPAVIDPAVQQMLDLLSVQVERVLDDKMGTISHEPDGTILVSLVGVTPAKKAALLADLISKHGAPLMGGGAVVIA